MSKTLRLGYLVPEFPSQTHAFFWRELSALRELGMEVMILSTRTPALDACQHAFAQQGRRECRYVYPPRWSATLLQPLLPPTRLLTALSYLAGLQQTPWKKRVRLLGVLACAAELAKVCQQLKLDHLHVHSCADAAHMAALAHRLGGPAYSLTLHGDLPVYGVDHRHKMKSASFVSVVTQALQNQVHEQIGLPVEKLPVIWMGVDTRKFVPSTQRKFELNQLHLLTVARLNAAKGHEHALHAMRQALNQGCDIRYTIAGDGPHRAAIEQTIAQLNLQSHVTLTGNVAEDRVLELLQHCDAFVLSSVGLGEAAPVSVMEAMSTEMPVIASIIGGTPDMIRDGVNGYLVPQTDQNGLAQAMIRLARDPALRQRIGHAARRRALEVFDSQYGAKLMHQCIHAAHAA